ncbi:MAG: hypothetical protein ACR2N3_05745 [Pyrinomonadaceae bacterium]
MKKFLAGLLVLFVLAMTVPIAEAQCSCHRRYRSRSYASRNYRYYQPSSRVYYQPRYRVAEYSYYRRPSFYQRHKHAIDVGIGTGAGALIGGIARGGRGAGIGALIGAGSGALYTYVLDKKRRRY